MMALVRYETDELDFALHSSHAFYLQVRLIKILIEMIMKKFWTGTW